MAALLLLLSSCGSEKVDVMFECASPTGRTVATFFRVTTGDRAIDAEMKLNLHPSGSAFDASMQSFSFRHGYDAVLSWHSDHELSVVYPLDSEITYQERVVFGSSQTFDAEDQIKLNYQEQASTHGYFQIETRCFNLSANGG